MTYLLQMTSTRVLLPALAALINASFVDGTAATSLRVLGLLPDSATLEHLVEPRFASGQAPEALEGVMSKLPAEAFVNGTFSRVSGNVGMTVFSGSCAELQGRTCTFDVGGITLTAAMPDLECDTTAPVAAGCLNYQTNSLFPSTGNLGGGGGGGGEPATLASQVVAVNVGDATISASGKPLRLYLPVAPGSLDGNSVPQCAYYDFALGGWASDGCIVNDELSSSAFVVCDCVHTTHFATLRVPVVLQEDDDDEETVLRRLASFVNLSLWGALSCYFVGAILLLGGGRLTSVRGMIAIHMAFAQSAAAIILVVHLTWADVAAPLCGAWSWLIDWMILGVFGWRTLDAGFLARETVQVPIASQIGQVTVLSTLVIYVVSGILVAIVRIMTSWSAPQNNHEFCWLHSTSKSVYRSGLSHTS